MTIQINDLKSGLTIEMNGDVFMVVSVDHVKPGKGSAFARTKLKNLKLGTVIDRTFKTSESIQDAYVDRKQLQFSYRDGEYFHFLDQETFEDTPVHQDHLEETRAYLKDNLTLTGYFYKGVLLNIELPMSVVYTITHTEPGIRGDTAKGATKPATIESGATVTVPLFVNTGDRVRVDTRTGSYLGRE